VRVLLVYYYLFGDALGGNTRKETRMEITTCEKDLLTSLLFPHINLPFVVCISIIPLKMG